MRIRHRHQVITAAVAVSALLTALIAVNSAGAATTIAALDIKAIPALSTAQTAGSVAYLRAQYGISAAEAMRRLDLQQTAEEIDTQLKTRFPDAYGGMWLDQAVGGVLRVDATAPAKLAAALRHVPDAAHVQVQRVRWSLAQLTAMQQRLDAAINATGPLAEIVTDEVNNDVVVYQRDGAMVAGTGRRTGAAVTAAEGVIARPDPRISAIVATQPGAVLRQLIIGELKSATIPAPLLPTVTTPASCNPATCPPPLRGGTRLDVKRTTPANDPDDINPLWGECTNGFNVYSSVTKAYYVLTAGHCVVGANKSGKNHTYNNARHAISDEVYDFENGPTGSASTYPVDYSIQPVSDYNYWLKGYSKNQLDVYCQKTVSTWQGCTNKTMSITGYVSYSAATIGSIVCATSSGDNDPNNGYHSSGAAPGTRCGEITGKNGGIKTNICSRKGDSGEPLFSEVTGLAYGILNDGTAGTGDCPTNPPGTEWSQYSPIDKILAHVKAQTIRVEGKDYKFVLRTTP